MHNVFYISLLKQNITRKRQIDENDMAKLDANNNEGGKYKVKAIWDSAVYAKELELNYLLRLYYLVFWKSYLKDKNI